MTLLSRKADYAILILSYLHRQNSGGNARAIAESFGLSRPFLANILKELCQKGYVASHRGVKGGYAILRPLNNVTIIDLLESLDEGFRLTLCNTHHNGSTDSESCALESNCTVKGPLGEVHRRIRDVLATTTLADLIQNQETTSKVETTNDRSQTQALPSNRLTSLPMAGKCDSTQPQKTNSQRAAPTPVTTNTI